MRPTPGRCATAGMSKPLELVGVADAGQHEQLRRVDRAAGEDHLALGPDAHGAPACEMIDADRAHTFAAHSLHQRTGAHGQVRPAPGRVQVRARRAPAAPAPDRHVHRREALLLVAVHVGGEGIAGLAPRLEEGLVQRIAAGAGRDVQRSIAAPVVVGAARARLGALEIGQDVGVIPAGQTALRPAIVVAGVAAHVRHAVDRRRAAEHPAARAVDAPTVHVRLGLAPVAPVVALALQRIRERRRHVQLPGPRVVDRPRLEQQHAYVRILAQPVGEHAAGRAGADHDVIEAFGSGHAVRLSGMRRKCRPPA